MSIDFNWFLATGSSSSGVPQPDPNASLSGRVSTTTAYALQSTLTGVGANARTTVIDTTQIASPTDWTGAWLVFESGANESVAREITSFDDGTGTFTFAIALDADAVAAVDYRVWTPNDIFNEVSNVQSVARTAKYRLLMLQNQSGVTLSDYRCWIEPLSPGPSLLELAQGRGSVVSQPVIGIANEEDVPEVSAASDFIQAGWSSGAELFQNAPNEGVAYVTTPLSVPDFNGFSNNQYVTTFLKLGFPRNADIPIAHRAVFQVHCSASTGPRVGSMIVIADVLGADEVLVLGPDRVVRLGAGARIEASVTDSLTGLPVPNHTVSISQTSGPGTLNPQSATTTDDSGNPIRAVYLAPTDPGEVGNSATFRVEVN
ncbi:MAG: hypothetical protein WBG86_06295 [Polyangiales bacterium]